MTSSATGCRSVSPRKLGDRGRAVKQHASIMGGGLPHGIRRVGSGIVRNCQGWPRARPRAYGLARARARTALETHAGQSCRRRSFGLGRAVGPSRGPRSARPDAALLDLLRRVDNENLAADLIDQDAPRTAMPLRRQRR